MLKYRLISFPLLLGLVYVVFFLPKYGSKLFIILAVAIISLALFECGKLFNRMEIPNFPLLSAFFGGCAMVGMPSACHFGGKWIYLVVAVLLAAVPILFSCVLLKKEKFFKGILGSFAVFSTLGVSLILLSVFYYSGTPEKPATNLLLYLILTVKAMDTGGYIFGMLTTKLLPGGNHKIAPNFSPKKSWEGFFGGLAFSVAVSLAFWHFGSNVFSWQGYLVSGVVLGILSFFGDLTESGIKRRCGVKDSAEWIPGMGGIFDVVDSFIYVGPVAAIFSIICHVMRFF